jgi:hypothetical protein
MKKTLFWLFLMLLPGLYSFNTTKVEGTIPSIPKKKEPIDIFHTPMYSFPEHLLHGLRVYGSPYIPCSPLELNLFHNGMGNADLIATVDEATNQIIDILPAEFQDRFGVFEYAQYPYLALMNHGAASEEQFQRFKTAIDLGCPDAFYFMIGKQIDPRDGSATFKTVLKLPRTGAFADMNSSVEEIIRSYVDSELKLQYQLHGFSSMMLYDVEVEGLHKLKEFIMQFLDGTLPTGMSEELLKINGFWEANIGSSIPLIQSTDINNLGSNNLKDYAGLQIEQNGESVSFASQALLGHSQSEFSNLIGTVITDNNTYTSGSSNEFELATITFQSGLSQKIIIWLHYFAPVDVTKPSKLYYKWRLNGFTRTDAQNLLATFYTDYESTIPTPSLGAKPNDSQERADCYNWGVFTGKWRMNPGVIDCMPTYVNDVNIFFGYALDNLSTNQMKYIGGVCCGLLDGVLDTLGFVYDVGAGLLKLSSHIPFSYIWYLDAIRQVVKEASFWEGIKNKIKDDANYWLKLSSTVTNFVSAIMNLTKIGDFFYHIFNSLKIWAGEIFAFRKGTVKAGYRLGKLAFEIVLFYLTGGTYSMQQIKNLRYIPSNIYKKLSGIQLDILVDKAKNFGTGISSFLDDCFAHCKSKGDDSVAQATQAACKVGLVSCFTPNTLVNTFADKRPIVYLKPSTQFIR